MQGFFFAEGPYCGESCQYPYHILCSLFISVFSLFYPTPPDMCKSCFIAVKKKDNSLWKFMVHIQQ